METYENIYLGVKLKPNYFNEFIICGIPVPRYCTINGFVLKFEYSESYLNYVMMLQKILGDLELADIKNEEYEIQRSKAFVKNILLIIKNQFSEKYN